MKRGDRATSCIRNKDNIDRVVATNGNEVCGIVASGSPDNMDLGWVCVFKVHVQGRNVGSRTR